MVSYHSHSQASRTAKGKTNVDETLFKATGASNNKNQVATSTGVISLDELRQIREKTMKNNQTDAVVISKTELDRMKQSTVIKTKEDKLREKQLIEDQQNAALASSKARREKMQALDEQRAQKVRPSEFAVLEKQKAEGLLSKA